MVVAKRILFVVNTAENNSGRTAWTSASNDTSSVDSVHSLHSTVIAVARMPVPGQ